MSRSPVPQRAGWADFHASQAEPAAGIRHRQTETRADRGLDAAADKTDCTGFSHVLAYFHATAAKNAPLEIPHHQRIIRSGRRFSRFDRGFPPVVRNADPIGDFFQLGRWHDFRRMFASYQPQHVFSKTLDFGCVCMDDHAFPGFDGAGGLNAFHAVDFNQAEAAGAGG
jgi:hypothetical protein